MRTVTWITGMPRSGTNWLAQIFASSPAVRLKLCPLFSYEFKNALNEFSAPDEWLSFFKAVYSTESEYMDQGYLRKQGVVPEFQFRDFQPDHLVIKSTRFHNLTRSILQVNSAIRFVAIIRHPCATIHSWLTNPLEFPKNADPDTEWMTGACRKIGAGEFWGFADWKVVTKLHLSLAQEYPERFILVRYEELVTNALQQVEKIFGQLNIPVTEQTISFLAESQSVHNTHKRAVFKSPEVKDRWKTEMAPEIIQAIKHDLEGTALCQFIQE